MTRANAARSPSHVCARPSHSTQDSIAIRLVNWTEWRKIMQIGRRQAAGLLEETLPVRYYDWIAHFGRRTPDKLAVVDLASERHFSYAQFDARISRLAAYLRDQLKIARGHRAGARAVTNTHTPGAQPP